MAVKILAGTYDGKDQVGNELVEGGANAVVIKDRAKFFGGKTAIAFSEIAEIEEVNDEILNKGPMLGFGVLGLAVAGPLGAAIGAGIGGITGKTVFLIKLTNGEALLCQGWRLIYKSITKAFKIHYATRRISTPPLST